jgi:phosphoribosylglycinamide formyltransferase-1
MSGLRLCVVSNSGGSAFKAFFHLAGIHPANVLVLTDRPCGIEDFARDHAIQHVRLEGLDNKAFSDEAARQIDRFGHVDVVFLFFMRLVTASLFARFPVINLHPALLPAFPGLRPIPRALESGVKFFGTTMHVVDATVDGGRILAQASHPLRGDEQVRDLQHIAFLQKVYLLLLVAEHHEIVGHGPVEFSGWPCGDRWNPCLQSAHYLERYAAFVQSTPPPAPLTS